MGFGVFYSIPALKTFHTFALVHFELPVNFLPCYTKCFLKCSKWDGLLKCTPCCFLTRRVKFHSSYLWNSVGATAFCNVPTSMEHCCVTINSEQLQVTTNQNHTTILLMLNWCFFQCFSIVLPFRLQLDLS